MRVNGVFFLAVAMMAGPAIAGQSVNAERTATRVVTKKVPHKTIYELSRLVRRGQIRKVQDGRDGEVKRVYKLTLKDGKPVGKTLVSKVYIEPQHTVFRIGRSGYETPSRSRFRRSKVLTMKASAYDTSQQTLPGTTGRGALGMYVKFGHVAVDRRVIPLGTMVFVEGYGFAIASDTGGAIKGNRIDLCMNSRAEALRFGRKTVKVHILAKP